MTKIISAIDIGSGKICCMIAQAENNGDIKILGFSEKQSRAIKNGLIQNADTAKNDILNAVRETEAMAKVNIGNHSTVNINGFHPKSKTIELDLILDGREVRQEDIIALRNKTKYNINTPENYQQLHYFEQGFRIDGEDKLQKNPLSMKCHTLSLKSQLLFAPQDEMNSLQELLRSCDLGIATIIYTPYASSHFLLDQEKQQGTLLIDIGAQTTSFCIYKGGAPIFCDSISKGGEHVTEKIAETFKIPMPEAEKLKAVHGNLIESSADEKHILRLSDGGDDSMNKSALTHLIRSEMFEIMGSLEGRLDKGGIQPNHIRNIVVTGGGAHLSGMVDFLDECFSRSVRFCNPSLGVVRSGKENSDLFDNNLLVSGSQFACVIGMLRHSTLDLLSGSVGSAYRGRGFWQNLWHWIIKDPI